MNAPHASWKSSDITTTTLREIFDYYLCDLDGTVFHGTAPIPVAIDTIQLLPVQQVHYLTNNGSKTPAMIREKLEAFGLQVEINNVLNSAQCISAVMTQHISSDDLIYVLGAQALLSALQEQGFKNTITVEDINQATGEQLAELTHKVHHCAAVVQSLNPQTTMQNLADAAVAIHNGAQWFASNTDNTLPSEKGTLLGNGALVEALGIAVHPKTYITAGKPDPALLNISIEKIASTSPDSPEKIRQACLMIGDRINTDIGAANNAHVASFCVLTGVSSLHDVLVAPTQWTPTFISEDFSALNQPIENSLIHTSPQWRVHWNHSRNTIEYQQTATTPPWHGVLSILDVARTIPDNERADVTLERIGEQTPDLDQLFHTQG